MKRSAKKKLIGLFLLVLTICATLLIYLSIPVVTKVTNSHGQKFDLADNWEKDSIAAIYDYLENAENIEAFMALEGDKLIFKYGEVDKLINLHSARKPIMSLLIGIAKDKGLIDIEETLGQLGITEANIELSPSEKSATIRHLLMAKSGVYIDADAQPTMNIERPKRGQYKPGEFYYYNNFDFNVLATILKLKTGKSYEECLNDWIAEPLGMQEFTVDNVVYGTPFTKLKTQHPAYKTWMSARDFAKIGSMIAQGGLWKGKRIISEEWIRESTSPHHTFAAADNKWPKDGFAYLWAVDTQNSNIWGSGYGGQFLMIDTSRQLTLVQRHYTGNSLLSQGLYLRKNSQGSPVDLMQVWYALLRTLASEH